MATIYSASESSCGEGTRHFLRSESTLDSDSEGCLGNFSNLLSVNFCNIRGLRFNFHSVEHHISSSKPHLFLTETQVSEATDSSLYSVPSYFLLLNFRPKLAVASMYSCSHAHHLDSSEFSTIWVKLSCYSITKYICVVYLFPNSTDYVRFFEYFNSKWSTFQCLPPALAFIPLY